MDQQVSVRSFQPGDVRAITAIYNHYVAHSTATFDEEPASEAFMADKFGHMVELGHPVLVAERGGVVLAYAYASVYRPRLAYRFTCENTVYCAPDALGIGLGTLLLTEIIAASRAFGFKQMVAVITAESTGSIRLHQKLGFSTVGTHPGVGFKFDRWIDVTHMQLAL